MLLVSLDGLRFDYLENADTPNIDRLISEGARAKSLVPPFPSKTFPSHWSQVTGLHPENHGIVDNTIYDPETDSWFSMVDDEATANPHWWLGEPVWSTAERQGLKASTVFWPGSEAISPSTWIPYTGTLDWDERAEIAFDWLSSDEPPEFVTLYISEPDSTGHDFGPDHPELTREIETVDAWVGRLIEELEERRLDSVDLVLVSDHGMTEISPERMVFLDDAIDTDAHQIITWSPITNLFTTSPDEVVEALGALEHIACARKQDLDERLHFAASDRIGDVVCIADEGWSVSSRGFWAANPDWYEGGTHGFDPELESMHGILVARGPSFESGASVDAVDGVDVYELLCAALGIEPAPNDGDFSAVEPLLR